MNIEKSLRNLVKKVASNLRMGKFSAFYENIVWNTAEMLKASGNPGIQWL